MPYHLAQVNIYTSFFGSHPGSAVLGGSLGWLIGSLLVNIIVFAGILFFFLIIYAGFLLILYGGQYNPPAVVAKAKAMVTYGVTGFLLVIASYFILQIISTITGVNFVNLPLNL